ncbi:MFS transporter [Pseudonocardia sp. C8]|uniref:MFS transporter n=1 Tax=Pseudonocardia sp. C8 TaxID=2762759 RepID=UPI00164268F2|nr:MFS transporter [Pseudonocardia sp. C8]MBC3191894.1 MFS transporter [Pseudonocardia sp. C8]
MLASTRSPWFPATAAVFVGAWGVNQFTPIAAFHRADGAWPVLQVAAMFSIYVLGFLPALLWGGPAADRHGRGVVRHALVLSATASVLLALGHQWPPMVYVSRLATGAAAGVLISAGTAWIGELSAASGNPAAGARRSTLATVSGFAAGALGTGAMLQWLPWPVVVPELVHASMALTALAALRRTPDTVPNRSVMRGVHGLCWATTRHPRFLGVVLPAGPAVFAAATVAYVVLPTLVSDRVSAYAPLFSGAVTALTLGVGVAIQPVAARIDRDGSARAILVAMLIVVAGLVVGAAAAQEASPVLVLAAAATLGAGYGLVLAAGLREIERLAPPGSMRSATAIYHALAHGGMLTPLILAAGAGAAPYPVLLVTLAVIGVVCVLVAAGTARVHQP